MQPSQEPDNSTFVPNQTSQPPKKQHRSIALLLIIGPSALIMVTIIANAIINRLMFGNSDKFGYDSSQTFVSIIMSITGIIGMLSFVPGLIIGIILLNKK